MNKHPDADVMINFASLRSAYDATLEAMQFPQVSAFFLSQRNRFVLFLNCILMPLASHCWIVFISQVIPYDCEKTNDNPLYIYIGTFFGVVFPIQWDLAGAGGAAPWAGASNSKVRLITYCKRWMCFVAIHLSLLLNHNQSSEDGMTFILHKLSTTKNCSPNRSGQRPSWRDIRPGLGASDWRKHS